MQKKKRVNRQNYVKTHVWLLNSSLTLFVIMAVVEVTVNKPQLCITSPPNWIIFRVQRQNTTRI